MTLISLYFSFNLIKVINYYKNISINVQMVLPNHLAYISFLFANEKGKGAYIRKINLLLKKENKIEINKW